MELQQIEIPVRPRRRNPMWQLTHARGFMETDPFTNSTFLNDEQPFIGKKNPFRL